MIEIGSIKHALKSKNGIIGMGIGAIASAPIVGTAVNAATKAKWLKEAKKLERKRRHHHHHHHSKSDKKKEDGDTAAK